MRKIVVAVALLFAVSSQSQQGRKSEAIPQPNPVAAPPPLVEKIDVSVVNVDVTVTDRRGQPVSGLTRDDFEVFEDDKPQTISNFYAVDSSQPRIDTRPGAADNPSSADRFRRKVLVLIDNQNTTPHGRNVALDRLVEFIDQHFDDGRYDWSLATIDKRIHMVLPMTSSKRVLHDVVAQVRKTGTLSAIRAPMQHGEFDIASVSASSAGRSGGRDLNEVITTNRGLTTENTIDIFSDELSLKEQSIFAKSSTESILEAERAFGNLEGRKIILLVTGNLPLGTQSPLNRDSSRGVLDADVQGMARQNGELAEMRELLVREANASNTSLYIVSSEGLDMNMTEGMNPMAAGPVPGSNAIDTSSMLWLAKETGGAYLPGNRIDQSLVDFDRRSGAFYSLGYSPVHTDDGHYYKLKVNVKKHRDYRLDYRYGYSSAPTDLQIIRALSSPLGASMQQSMMPISLTFGEPIYRGLVALIPLRAAMSMDSLQYITDGSGSRTRLHVYVSIFDSEGRNLTVAKSFADIAVQANESTTGPMTVTIPPLALAKGSYKIVVAVRDELTDHIGVTTKRLEL